MRASTRDSLRARRGGVTHLGWGRSLALDARGWPARRSFLGGAPPGMRRVAATVRGTETGPAGSERVSRHRRARAPRRTTRTRRATEEQMRRDPNRFWNPYVAGVALGVVLLATYLLMGK